MKRNSIGAIAAMAQEITPLLRRIKPYQKECRAGFNWYRFQVQETSVTLVESGMGPQHAKEATEALIGAAAPGVILNFGLAGGVLPGLAVGDLVLAERVLSLEPGGLLHAPLTDQVRSNLVAACCAASAIDLRQGTFITAAAIMNKGEVAASLRGALRHPVLEMETAAVLRAAEQAGIPVVAVRGISDAAEEEMGFSLDEFCDTELRISLARVLGCVARKPWIIPQLVRLAADSAKAGRNLALCVEIALQALAGEAVAKR